VLETASNIYDFLISEYTFDIVYLIILGIVSWIVSPLSVLLYFLLLLLFTEYFLRVAKLSLIRIPPCNPLILYNLNPYSFPLVVIPAR
jgi:hypothetical protein